MEVSELAFLKVRVDYLVVVLHDGEASSGEVHVPPVLFEGLVELLTCDQLGVERLMDSLRTGKDVVEIVSLQVLVSHAQVYMVPSGISVA